MSDIAPESTPAMLRLLAAAMERGDNSHPDFVLVVARRDGSFASAFKADEGPISMVGMVEAVKRDILCEVE